MKAAITVPLLYGLCFSPTLYGNPSGASVISGDISFGGSAGNLLINQGSDRAIIDWDSFSIAPGELTQFIQPGTSSAVLNRVTGSLSSSIHGSLAANGNVFLINPNGILIGAGGRIDVHGLALSTLDVSNGEFLAGGDLLFKGASKAGIVNAGQINGIGGDVFLIGRHIRNDGNIDAANGVIGLGAGTEVLLQSDSAETGERILVRATGSGVGGTGITNNGTIEGAALELKAHGNLYALAINNKGSLRATGVSESGGRVYLNGGGGSLSSSGFIEASGPNAAASASAVIRAAYARVGGEVTAINDDGSGGSVVISSTQETSLDGVVDVSGSLGRGGDVRIEGEVVQIGSAADISADGATGGGSIRIGGGFQGKDAEVMNASEATFAEEATASANSIKSGDGGSIVLWADKKTVFEGSLSAAALGTSGNGGQVEVSAKEELYFRGDVSTASVNGSAGWVLLDPTDFDIIAGVDGAAEGANEITDGRLETLLGSNSVIISTLDADPDNPAGDDGTITVNEDADVTWSSGSGLTLLAHQNIDIFASLQNSGSGDITLVAGWDGVTGVPAGAGVISPATPPSASLFVGNTFGGNMGSITIGDDGQQAAVAVGSREGTTHASAYGVSLLARDRTTTPSDVFAQFGYRSNDSNAVTGNLSMNLKGGGLSLAGGRTDSYAQVGHGGLETTGDASLAGDITITFYEAGAMSLISGSSSDAYTQIGHGGGNQIRVSSGNI